MRRALLIATDTYRDPTFGALRAPRLDAAELDTVLSDPAIGGFTTEVLVNEPVQHLRERIETVLGQAGRDDLVLLYLSGHGVKARLGDLHFVTTDTRHTVLATTSLDAAFVRRQIDDSLAGRVVVWLDCCYGGAFPSGMLPRATEDVDVVQQLTEEGRGCVVMTASTHIQYAYEPVGDHVEDRAEPSVFTKAIIDGLRTGAADLDHDGEIGARDLYRYVYDHVRRTNPDQTPTSSGTLSGDVRIAYAGTPLPAELAPELRRLLRSSDEGFRRAGLRILDDRARTGDQVSLTALRALADGVDRDLSAAARELLAPEAAPAAPPQTSDGGAVVGAPEPHTVPGTPATTTPRHHPRPHPSRAAGAAAPVPAPEGPPPPRGPAPRPGRPPWPGGDLRPLLRRPVPKFDARGVAGSGHLRVVFSNDSSMLGTGAVVRSTNRWQPVFELPRYAEVRAFSPDNRLVVAAEGAGLAVYRTSTWDEVARVFTTGRSEQVCFNHDGTMLAVRSGGTVTLFQDAGDGWRALTEPVFHDVRDTRFCPDTPRLVVATDDGRVELWDTTNWTRLGSTALDDVRVTGLRYGALLAAASKRVVTVWRADTWEVVGSARLDGASFTGPVGFGPGLDVLICRGWDGLELRGVVDGQVERTIPTDLWSPVLSADGRFLAGVSPYRSFLKRPEVWVWTRHRADAAGLRAGRKPPRPSVAAKNDDRKWVRRFGAVGGGAAATGVLVGAEWAFVPALGVGGALAAVAWWAVDRIWPT
ncbi:caspase family protein [Actinosynnema sp. NPDC059335]|uniref:caspase, EACC1-associated type n=1 Tax=Actinosynnema sp. NPDC059335 TaxID=3346804 RepID=UPI00366EC424